MNRLKIGRYSKIFLHCSNIYKAQEMKIGYRRWKKMKITNEKMRDELTRLYTDYAREREKIEKEAKENGEWLEIGLDSNQHLFKKLNDEVKKKEKMIIAKYKEQ